MGSRNDNGVVSQTPLATIALYQIVKRSAGGVDVCGASDAPYGVSDRNGVASGTDGHEKIPVALLNKPGTHLVRANGVIAEGAEFEMAADGEITAQSAGTARGTIETVGGATADQHIVEVVFY